MTVYLLVERTTAFSIAEKKHKKIFTFVQQISLSNFIQCIGHTMWKCFCQTYKCFTLGKNLSHTGATFCFNNGFSRIKHIEKNVALLGRSWTGVKVRFRFGVADGDNVRVMIVGLGDRV